MEYRIGFSKDIHKLVENRKLIIAGVVIPFDKGELAHSDGDVLYHALAESILGALALGDLGKHFPDTSKDTLDMDSSLIVKSVVKMMKEKGYQVNNVDIFVSLEKPKLKDYIEEMKKNVASLLEVNLDQVSIKAGTNEGCGEVGRGEAIEATSMIMLKSYC
ncbi:MAG: 2-C-methyl-D-erythritol 2,4-cyclodiphosphate synthase [Bacilli bacterium]|nr:2-C-methyl-D-erythritol 2,4-cyclodiphosphate synthase [Bacilli bacterium]